MLSWGCFTKERGNDFSYIKVITGATADTTTEFNKGITAGTFLYYEPQKDSFVFCYPTKIEPREYQTYLGHLQNPAHADTIRNLLRVLRRHGNGDLSITFPPGYEGAKFYVEYKDESGVHNNAFDLIYKGDTIDQFSKFYCRLTTLSLSYKAVNNRIINTDSQWVNLSSKVGEYQTLETPYIPLACKPGIDFTKLYGTWRKVDPNRSRTNYGKWTFEKNGNCRWERIKKDTTAKTVYLKFRLNRSDQSIIIIYNGEAKKYKIMNLSDSCFEYRDLENFIVRYNRL